MRKFLPAALLGVSMTGFVQGANVYKCVDGKGAITFQQIPCAPGATQAPVKLHAEPPPPTSGMTVTRAQAGNNDDAHDSVTYIAVPSGTIVSRDGAIVMPLPTHGATQMPDTARAYAPAYASGVAPFNGAADRSRGFECTTAAGHTFYRVDECPRNVSMGSLSTGQGGSYDVTVPVQSREISNAEACNKMGRQSMRYDTVSSYDKRNGKDPCC